MIRNNNRLSWLSLFTCILLNKLYRIKTMIISFFGYFTKRFLLLTLVISVEIIDTMGAVIRCGRTVPYQWNRMPRNFGDAAVHGKGDKSMMCVGTFVIVKLN